jgi:hypothetical protein
MTRLLSILESYDSWCLAHMESTLCWLEEWLSISQRATEITLLSAYVVFDSLSSLWGVAFSIFNGTILAVFIFSDATQRRSLRSSWLFPRMISQVVFLSLNVPGAFYPPIHLRDIAFCAAYLSLLLFYYSIAISSSGERGRKRKLAAKKLKELFAGWVPEPLPPPEPALGRI